MAADQIDFNAMQPPPPPPPSAGGAAGAATAKPARSTWKERQRAAVSKSLVTATPVASIGAPVSEDEARKLAAEIEQAVKAGDRNRLSALFDYAAMAESVHSGLDIPAAQKLEIEQSLRNLGTAQGAILDGFVQVGKGKDVFKLLRVATRRDCPVARFRLSSGDHGLGYHDFMLARRGDGQVKIVDLYVYMMGETITDSVRQFVVAALAAQPKGFFGQVTPQDREFLEAAPRLKQLKDAKQAGQHALTVSIIDSLPASLRRMKTVMLARMEALEQLKKDAEVVAAIEEYRRLFPDDPSCDLVTIDADILQKRYDATLLSVDRLDKAVGGDPGLDRLRALVLLLAKKNDAAAEAARKALEYDPTDLHAHKVLAFIAAEAKEYDKVAARLDEMKEKCGYDVKEIGTDSRFLPFGMSDTGKAWLRKHGLLPPGR